MLYKTPNPHGGDIYTAPVRLDFSASINPLGTPPAVMDALREAAGRAAQYPDPYCREAVRALSEYEGVPEEQILLGNGSAELIYAFCRAAAPRRALIAVPAFSEYESALGQTRCEVIHHRLLPENDFRLDDSFVGAIRAHKPDCVFLCSPGNPTGRLIDPEQIRDIISCCAELNVRVFLDECFLDLTGVKMDLNGDLAGAPHLFLLKALTKSYALAGVRVGYCLSADRALLAKMAAEVQPWNVSVFAQAAAAAAVKETEYLRRSVEFIRAGREYLSTELSRLGFCVIPSDANFILFRAPVGLDQRLREQGIAIRHCGNFAGLEPGWYRIAVRTQEENEALIGAIRQIGEAGGL